MIKPLLYEKKPDYIVHEYSIALESYALFRKYGVDSYLIEGFEVLHTQGEDFILEDIEIYIQNHSKI